MFQKKRQQLAVVEKGMVTDESRGEGKNHMGQRGRNGSLMRYYSEELTFQRDCTALQCTVVIEQATYPSLLRGAFFGGKDIFLGNLNRT